MSKESKSLSLLLIVAALLIGLSSAKRSMPECRGEQECQMKRQHFALYSNVKQNLIEDFKHMQGKDLVPFIRSVELLRKRFGIEQQAEQLNGTDLVMSLLEDKKLIETMEMLGSEEGRQLVTLYKSSINSQEQNLACSQWRVQEIEVAAQRLEKSARLSAVFSNIHKQFVERSARKCLKTSCKAINDNMNHLDSVLRRRSSRRKATTGGFAGGRAPAGVGAAFRDNNNELMEIVARDDNFVVESGNSFKQQELSDDLNEFHQEELELCRFLKRTNSTSCQASGNELSSISFARNIDSEGGASSGASKAMGDKLTDLLADYERQLNERQLSKANASSTILANCGAIKSVLEYHLFAIRWYTKQEAIRLEKFQARANWCPSLSYWLEIDRLCGELNSALKQETTNDNNTTITFAY